MMATELPHGELPHQPMAKPVGDRAVEVRCMARACNYLRVWEAKHYRTAADACLADFHEFSSEHAPAPKRFEPSDELVSARRLLAFNYEEAQAHALVSIAESLERGR